MKYNDMLRTLGMPENPNADLAIPFAPESELEQAPIKLAPVALPPQSAPVKSSLQDPGLQEAEAALAGLPESKPESQLERLERLSQELQTNRAKELEDANRRQMYQDILSGVNSNLGLIVGGAQAMNTKAAVTPAKAGEIKQRDFAKEVSDRYKVDQEAMLEKYKALTKAQQEAAGITDYQRQRLELDRDRLGLMRDIEQGRGNRFYDNLGFRKEEKNELSDKQVESMSSFGKVEGLLSDIRGRIPEFRSKLGPYASEIELKKSLIPGFQEDPKFAAFRATVSDQLSQYIKSLSGLTVSDKERAALLTAVPTVKDKADVFTSKLNEMEKRLNQYKQIELEDIKKFQGKTSKEPTSPSPAPAPVENVIIRRDPKTGRNVKYDAATKKPLGWAD
jgi:hypothetical protein